MAPTERQRILMKRGIFGRTQTGNIKFKQKLASNFERRPVKTKAAPTKELVDPNVLDRLLTGFHLIARDKKELNKFSKLNTGSRASWPTHKL